MTREEAINMLKSKMDGHTDTSYEWVETVRMAIEALEQEPSEELDFVQPHKKVSVNLEVCKMREATRKEREGIEQYIDSIAKPCEDCISREAARDLMYHKQELLDEYDLDALPSVTPKPKTEPCEDAISRQAVKEQLIKYGFHAPDMTVTEFVEDLQPVNSQPKTGHWIVELKENVTEYIVGTGCHVFICSACQEWQDKRSSYCPVCGSRMFEPQE